MEIAGIPSPITIYSREEYRRLASHSHGCRRSIETIL